MEALRLYTVGSSWFSSEDGKKGSIAPGQLADLSVLSADYFSIPEEQIKQLQSVLTIVGGKVVYAAKEFSKLAPPPLPVSPDWSPVKYHGGYAQSHAAQAVGGESGAAHARQALPQVRLGPVEAKAHRGIYSASELWNLGCDCFAF